MALSPLRPDQVVLGIDIGGSGIKGAPVDLLSGELLSERQRLPTPQPATPKAVAKTVAKLVKAFSWQGPVGCTFPAVIKRGVAYTAANVDKRWIGTNAEALFAAATGCPVTVLNDADAAGLAELRLGAGRDQTGMVLVLTFGTGIGSALFMDGRLLPNTELGHLELAGREVEPWASDRARQQGGLSWKKWARRVDRYLRYLEALFSPDLFIVGGGVSKKADKFLPHLSVRTPVVPALLRTEAGIVGAALAAAARYGGGV
jgi:polyphosphate glucokinase